jgi:adenine phosphoribosyltransferase
LDAPTLRALIRTVPDWPKPGVNFFDICSIVEHPSAFSWTVQELTRLIQSAQIEAIVSPDARGFIWGAAVAYAAKLPLHLARKPGKLPGATVSKSYQYEYAETSISMQANCPLAGKRVLIVDDVLATGGTALAIVSLLQSHFQLTPERIGLAAVINLSFLGGEQRLRNRGVRVHSLLTCPHE